ncbi:MAG TPA: VOC family protein [Burkholderiaceae bacterium]|nr:VOC family protein [Burkholderiaceae bacterium]
MRRSELDHIVIACSSLDNGVEWVEQRLGARPTPGGQHLAMGTHNALLRLGARAYLEVIAIDPEGIAPSRPRWFALDEPEMQALLARGPRLITWAVRCESLANACARVPELGDIMPMNRGDFHWKIAVPETGSLAWGGVLPTAIQWLGGDDGTVRHPCDALEDHGCELVRLQLSHPAAVLGTSGIMGMFRELRIMGPVDLSPGPKMLAATIRTPQGEVSLGQ